MSDPDAPQAARPNDLQALMDIEREPTPAVADALAELEAARSAAGESLDQLTSATQSALDIPAKIRRHPVRTAALIGGTGFLLAGGPRRVIRSASSRLRPSKPDPHAGLLPPQIERVLKDAGLADDPEVRRALDDDFADYLRQKGKYEVEPGPAASFWRTFDRVAGPLGTAGARILVQRLMEADQDRSSARTEVRRESRQKRAPGT
jgi:hypothetical protein